MRRFIGPPVAIALALGVSGCYYYGPGPGYYYGPGPGYWGPPQG